MDIEKVSSILDGDDLELLSELIVFYIAAIDKQIPKAANQKLAYDLAVKSRRLGKVHAKIKTISSYQEMLSK